MIFFGFNLHLNEVEKVLSMRHLSTGYHTASAVIDQLYSGYGAMKYIFGANKFIFCR